MVVRNRVGEYRERRGWTQIELANYMEMSQGSLSRIENSKQSPSIEVCYKLEEFFAVDIHDLFISKRGKIMSIDDYIIDYIVLDSQIPDKRSIYHLHSFLRYLALHQDQPPEPQEENCEIR